MMHKRFLSTAIAFAILLAPALCGAMDVVGQFPTFGSNMVPTTAPLQVVFDQSLQTESVDDDSFYVTLLNEGEHVAGSISFTSTNQAADTVVFQPGAPWAWGARYRVHISGSVVSVGGDPFTGGLPDNGIFAANIPNDFVIPVYDPEDPFGVFVGSTDLMGFNPLDPEADAEPWQITGSNITGAWKYTTGSPDVVIAILDDGIRAYDDPETRRAFFLNSGELPLPNVNGNPCADYDCNGDGRFDVDDYAADNRVFASGPVSVPDLLGAFSDGMDDDGNGLPDDICGWDFYRGSNLVLGITVYDLGTHGQGQLGHIASRGDNGIGSVPGVCPECMILPIRASDNIIYNYNLVAAGVEYAASMGASAINFAGVNFTWSDNAHQTVQDAYENGTLLVAASGDEMTYHHWMPACGEDVMNLKSIFSLVPIELMEFLNLELFGFTETFCTNYGPHVHLAVQTANWCTSDATALTSGMVGLMFSYAAQQGIDLEAGEAKQLLTMTAYDIDSHCASIVNLLGVCREGHDEHFGYGRPDLQRALMGLGDPDFDIDPGIPPVVRIEEPLWWQTFDPTETLDLDIAGEISSRVTPFQWRVQMAPGHQPPEDLFVTLEAGSSDSAIDGIIATVHPYEVVTDEWASGVPENQHTFEVTLRVQAFYDAGESMVLGESRKTLSLHVDESLVPGFPLWIGASGESPPVLYDLDGDADNRLEIVLGTGAGFVEALKYDEASGEFRDLPGFPVDITGDDSWVDDSIFGSVAVGDLEGDGIPEIVAATVRGSIYVIDPDAAADGGPVWEGFPVSTDVPDNTDAISYGYGNGFMTSPVLADLDNDGMLEIVAASMDQKVYAWKPVGSKGLPERLPGWPVLARSLEDNVPKDKVCRNNGLPSPILGTPAVGVLDPGHDDSNISQYPSVVVSTNEACGSFPFADTRLYAIFHNGSEHRIGPFLPGWPATPTAPFSDMLPIPIIAGASASPAVYAGEDGAVIVPGTTGWFPQLVRYSGGRLTEKDIPILISINAIGSPSISSLWSDGDMQLVLPVTGAVRVDELGFQLLNSRIIALNLEEPHKNVLESEVEDIPMLASSVVADLDNDGEREVIAGTGGYLVHAFSTDGTEAEGWPKWTHKWVMATPAVGDIDADGKLEVVAHTREGWLYAWETDGAACVDGEPNSDWRRFHHDERNTGFYGTDALPPSRVTDLQAEALEGDIVEFGFTAPGDDWNCGKAGSYDVRYATDDSVDLSDPEQFAAAPSVPDVPHPATAGDRQMFEVDAPGALQIAMRAIDEAGNVSRISNTVELSGDEDDNSDGDDDDRECCGLSQ